MAHSHRFGALAGVIAAASMTITPAQAAEAAPQGTLGYATSFHASLNQNGAFDLSTYDEDAETAEHHRRYRGYRRYRRNRIDGGDILAGALIIGGIAAVASAASNNNRRNRDRVVVRERERDNRRYDERRTNRSTSSGSGIDNAVSQCLNEIEQDVRVDNVDGASRVAEGWVVTGTIFNGSSFTCQIDNNGRISNVDYGGFADADNQWTDDRYADARSSLDGQRVAQLDEGPQPAYPGGPLPGEELSE